MLNIGRNLRKWRKSSNFLSGAEMEKSGILRGIPTLAIVVLLRSSLRS